jgi:hypothetical protein
MVAIVAQTAPITKRVPIVPALHNNLTTNRAWTIAATTEEL